MYHFRYKHEDSLHWLYSQFDAIHPLSSPCKAYLAEVLEEHSFDQGEKLLRANAPCKKLHFVVDGILHSYVSDGVDERTTWIFLEGSMCLSPESFFMGVPSKESIATLEPCLLYALSSTDLKKIERMFPEFQCVMSGYVQRAFFATGACLAAFRSLNAEGRCKWLAQTHPEWFDRAPHKCLADFVGIDKAHFSRIRKR